MDLKGIVIGLALMLSMPALSFGDMYCGSSLIRVGDSAARVLKRCGEPHYKTTTKIGLSSHEEIWNYEWSNRLPYAVTIRDGRVIKIRQN
jgi:hypothetical protein